MANITFVYPDFESLGVEYMMAVCRKDGHQVDFVFYEADDMHIGRKNRALSFFGIAKNIANTQPQVVGFSCVTENYQYQLGCARAIKEIMPDVVNVFGGIHPTAVPERVINEKAVDCVAIGEAENSFSDFLKECKIDKKCFLPDRPVKGVVYKSNGGLVGDFKEGELSDLNTLPFPYKKTFYSCHKATSREYYIITSRGCPYSCSYCFNSHIRRLRGKSILRQRTVDNVIAELIQAKREHSPKYITFMDDCFTANEDWLVEFCKRYEKEIRLPFRFSSIAQYLNNKKIQALRSAGCIHGHIGVQSLNKEICSQILTRNSDNAKIAETVFMLKEAGMSVRVDHMLGIPGDTLEMEEESVLFYNQLRPHIISVYWLTYYPKTAIIDIAKQKNILSDQDIENIDEGRALINTSYHTGGSMKDPGSYYGICLLLNWLVLLPKGVVRFLIKRKFYKKLSTKNYFISIYLPRFLAAILYRKNFMDRECVIRFIDKMFHRGAF